MTLNAYSYNAQPSVNASARAQVGAFAPKPSPVVTMKQAIDTALACLIPMTTSDPSIRIMRSDAINGVRSGNVAGCFNLASYIYTSGWSTSDAQARAIGHCLARYVLMATALPGPPPPGAPWPSPHDAYVLFSHF